MIPKLTFKNTHLQRDHVTAAPTQPAGNQQDTPVILNQPEFFKVSNAALENNEEFKKSRQQYRELIKVTTDFYSNNANSVTPAISVNRVTETSENLKKFTEKLYRLSNDDFGQDLYLIYGTAKESLHKIVDLLSNEKIPMQIRMDEISNMASKMTVCAGGVVTQLQETLGCLNSHLSGLLGTADEVKIRLTESTIIEFMKKEYGPYQRGMEVHIVNAFFNYIAADIGLPERLDNHVRIVEREIPTNLLEDFKTYALKIINPIKVSNFIANKYFHQLKITRDASSNDSMNETETFDVIQKIHVVQEATLNQKFGDVPYKNYLTQNLNGDSWRFTNQKTLLSRHFLNELINKNAITTEPKITTITPITLDFGADLGKFMILGELMWRELVDDRRELTGNDLLKIPPERLHSEIKKSTKTDIDEVEIYKVILNHMINSQKHDAIDTIDDQWLTNIIQYHPNHEISKTEYQPAMELAASFGCITALKKLLAISKDGIHYRNEDGLTPPMLSSKNGHVEAVNLFLSDTSRSLDENHIIEIFGIAAKHGHINIIKIKPVYDIFPDLKVRHKMAVEAISNRQIEVLKHMLDNTLISFDWRFNDTGNILEETARSGHLDVAKLFFGDNENQQNANERPSRKSKLPPGSALVISAERNDVAMIQYMLKKGIDPNAHDLKNDGHTPFTMASSKGHVGVMNVLIQDKRTDINAKDRKRRSALIHAARGGHLDAISTLVSLKKFHIFNDICSYEFNAFHHALRKKHPQAASLLIENNMDFTTPKDIESVNGNPRFTPSTFSIMHGYIPVVEAMIKKPLSFDINKPDPIFKLTPLQAASKAGRADMAALLIKHGANLNPESYFLSPLMLAARNRTRGIDEVNKLIESLLAAGARVDQKDSEHKTALMHSCINANTKNFASKLLEHGAQVNDVNRQLKTAMHFSAKDGPSDLINTLAIAGANLEAKDGNGWTPLMVGSAYNSPDSLATLLIYDKNINEKNNDQRTALSLSLENRKFDNAYLLIKSNAMIELDNTDFTRFIAHAAASPNNSSMMDVITQNIINNRQDYRGTHKIILWIATYLDDQNLIMYITDKGTPVDSVDQNQETALFAAVRGNLKAAATTLLQLGADRNFTNSDGKTPIDIAKENQNLFMLHLLDIRKKRKSPDA